MAASIVGLYVGRVEADSVNNLCCWPPCGSWQGICEDKTDLGGTAHHERKDVASAPCLPFCGRVLLKQEWTRDFMIPFLDGCFLGLTSMAHVQFYDWS